MTRGQAASEGEIHKPAPPPNTCLKPQAASEGSSPQLREKVPPVFDRIEGLVEIVQGNLAALVVFGCYPKVLEYETFFTQHWNRHPFWINGDGWWLVMMGVVGGGKVGEGRGGRHCPCWWKWCTSRQYAPFCRRCCLAPIHIRISSALSSFSLSLLGVIHKLRNCCWGFICQFWDIQGPKLTKKGPNGLKMANIWLWGLRRSETVGTEWNEVGTSYRT